MACIRCLWLLSMAVASLTLVSFVSVNSGFVSSLFQCYWPPTGYVEHTISVGYLNFVLTLDSSKLISRFVELF